MAFEFGSELLMECVVGVHFVRHHRDAHNLELR